MFERYTENARRVIFFARFEASQVGSPTIETEHLLLGVLREDKALTNRFIHSQATVESIRMRINQHAAIGERIATSVDIPLSEESKRVLAHAAEEAEKLGHKHIGTEHLLLGLLREKKCFAANILEESGLELKQIRDELGREPHKSEFRSVLGTTAADNPAFRLRAAGVTIARPETCVIDPEVEVASGTVIEPYAQLLGRTRVGKDCRIRSFSVIENCTLGDGVLIRQHCVLEDSTVCRRRANRPLRAPAPRLRDRRKRARRQLCRNQEGAPRQRRQGQPPHLSRRRGRRRRLQHRRRHHHL